MRPVTSSSLRFCFPCRAALFPLVLFAAFAALFLLSPPAVAQATIRSATLDPILTFSGTPVPLGCDNTSDNTRRSSNSNSLTDDSTAEGEEDSTVTLINAAKASIDVGTGTGTITDNDGTPTLTIADARATEGNLVEFTVTLDPASASDVTVEYATTDGTATANSTDPDGADYTAPANGATLTIGAGQTTGTISVATGNDNVDEDDETFTLTLSNPSSNAALGTEKTATGTIEDDDTDPAAISSIRFANTPSDGVYRLGNVIKMRVRFDKDVEVTGTPRIKITQLIGHYHFIYADYDAGVSTDRVLVFKLPVTSEIDNSSDGLRVGADSLQLNRGTIRNKGTTVNADRSHALMFTELDVRTRWITGIEVTSMPDVSETLTGHPVYGAGEEVEFTVTFSQTVTVDTASGTPQLKFNASDRGRQDAAYASGSGTRDLVFTWTVPTDVPGTEDPITIPGNVGSGVTLLTNAGLVLNDGTIRDWSARDVNARHGAYTTDSEADTTGPALVAAAEGAAVDGTQLVLTFERAAGVAEHLDEHSVPAATDFEILVQSAVRTVSGVAVDGATVTLTLSDSVGHAQAVTVGYAPGTDALKDVWGNNAPGFFSRSVRNDSPQPELSINDVTVDEGDGTAEFTVTLDAASGETVTVNYATSNGTALAGSDYTAASGILTFAAGDTSKTIDVTVAYDSLGETDEDFTVTLSNASNASIGDGEAKGTIKDNETPTFPSTSTTRNVPENTPAGNDLGGVLTATDTDSDPLTYTLEGTDQASFDLATTSGSAQLRTKTGVTYDHEAKSTYTVDVKADDTNGGTATIAVTITVTDVNEPPAQPAAPGVTATAGSNTSLTVTWTAPTNTGPPIDSYDLRYREGTTGNFTNGPQNVTGTSAAIGGLTGNTSYQVQVRATNDEGTSDWSESGEAITVRLLTVQMTPDLPPPVEGPFTVRFSFSETVRGFTISDIETQQEPACTDSANNPVFCNPGFAALQTTDDRIFTATITPRIAGLNHNYTLTITAPANTVTSVVGNEPNEAATLEVSIAPPGVTAPISTIGLRASVGNGRVTLRWDTPANTGGAAIVRYEYRRAESGGDFGDWMSVGSGARSATAPNLTNGAEYTFEVRPANSLGYGSTETTMATPVTVTPPPPPPPPPPITGGGGGGGGGGAGRARPPSYPGTIQAEGGDGAVTLTWNAPSSQGSSRIQHYEYRIDGEGEWISTGSSDRTHTIAGLINGRTYFFHLRAVSAAGAGSHRISPESMSVADLDFTHFANGGFITSTLALVNAGAYPVQPAIYFYDQDGDPIAARSLVSLNPDLEVLDDGALSPRTVMNPLGELTIATHGRGGLRVGSVTVRAASSIGGVLRFDIPGFGVAGVADSPTVRDALLPVRRQAMGINTGVAVRNRGTAALTVRCRLMPDGAMLEEADIRLQVNGQDSRFIDQVFPVTDTSDFAGSVRCAAPEPGRFSAVAFELDGVNRIFTTLPVVSVPAVPEQEQEEELEQEQQQDATRLDFTHFANGGGIVSSLALVNAGANPVRPAIYFYDQDGALRPGTAMNPLGELTISTHGRGGLKVGSVTVTADGPIGGVLRFDIPGLGVAGVGDSALVRDALVPVRRQADGINTGVAVHNRGATALLVRCRLMQAGAVLEETMIPLAANGQDSRFIDQVFPTADTSDFSGSVRCMTPEPGRFSAVAFELDGVHRIFTTLPVVPVVEVE